MDIKLNGINGDLYFNPLTKDFEYEDTTNQEITDIIVSEPGYWKEFPNVGCSLYQYQKGRTEGLYLKIKSQLQADGINIEVLDITLDASGELKINASGTR